MLSDNLSGRDYYQAFIFITKDAYNIWQIL